MSHWGKLIALYIIIYTFIYFLYNFPFFNNDLSIYNGYKSVIDIIIHSILFMPAEGGYPRIAGFISFLNKITWIGDSKIILNKCTKRTDIKNINKPLDKDILEIIYGSLLGDASVEKRKGGKGTRILFYQENSHTEYLLFLHRLIANLGYCNTNIPKLQTRLGKKGKIRKIIRFSTWTYNQFNEIHNNWYISSINPLTGLVTNKKVLPKNIDNYLSPLALAIWIMNDGGKSSKGLKLATNNFTLSEVKYLINILNKKYNIKANIHKTGTIDQYNIYILSDSMPILVNLIKPYIIPSMKYKLSPFEGIIPGKAGH